MEALHITSQVHVGRGGVAAAVHAVPAAGGVLARGVLCRGAAAAPAPQPSGAPAAGGPPIHHGNVAAKRLIKFQMSPRRVIVGWR